MVERLLAKEEVAGSNPVFRSNNCQIGARLQSAPEQSLGKRRTAVRSDISSLQHRPPNYLISRGHEDPLLLKEWILVLRGDGKSPRTIEGYADSVRQLAA